MGKRVVPTTPGRPKNELTGEKKTPAGEHQRGTKLHGRASDKN